ncbi:outer membrane receptor for ferrienterochelin and colicins [Chromohalobacter marismortui]|uniref:Outer membrane receptor for ferrienterochelin and colicins n=1 Tax=Chromohalobacter marismortui TaxID=42055 RepID=A0A4R7NMQ1_9GAMM|nr:MULTISPECIES: ligand-gated channel protein [Chromohalobacter]MCI0510163.1 ligand-gated channel protein [Chromohalobacter sp.]MCI0594531.1 ligand-gated channel protein [Chromohalobacter sp.]TDU21580.1 outer membrane receptor for ferrienterochelin and colicins [Chromohalobacter marismortui]
MSHYVGPSALTLAITTLVTPLAYADAKDVQLNDVVVTAAGYAQPLQDAPASISVISREQLENKAYRDITDALRGVPGVIVTGGGGGDNGVDISMRGMPAKYTLILVDGRRQSSRESRPNGSAGFEQDWLPPLQAIERIEVIRGPMSTLYGSDAIGGVINVITRKVADDWHGNVRAEATLQEDSDSGNANQGQLYVSGPLADDLLGVQVYGQYQKREEDDIEEGYEDKDLQSLTAKFSLTPSEHHDIGLEVGKETQERAAHVGKSVPAEGCRGGCSDSYSAHDREHYALTHTGRWGFATSDSYIQRESTDNKSRDIEITNTVANTQWVLPLSRHIVTLGANYEKEELNDQNTNQISDRTQVSNDQWALFAEDEWMLTRDFSLTGGVRLDDNENYGSHVSPRLYGVWQAAPRWTLKGGVSTGYRAPGLREVTADWGAISRGGTTYGNPALEPETSLNKELALLYSAPRGLNASVTLFHNDFEDKITRVRCGSATACPPVTQYDIDDNGNLLTNTRINVDEAVTRGVELSLSSPLTETLSVSTSYTYTDSEQKSGEYEGQPLTQLPKHQFRSTLDWTPMARLNAWVRLTYRGKESQPVEGPSSSSIQAPSYTYVDSGGAWQLTDKAKLMVGVYNLFDEDVGYEEYGYVNDGRRYWVGASLDF